MNLSDWTRRRFLQTATGAAAGATFLPACVGSIEDSANIAQQRKLLAGRKRRIIINNDGDDVVRAETPEDRQQGLTEWAGDLREDYLESRTTALVGSQVDSIFYASCAAGLTFSHHTKVGHFLDKATDPRALVPDLIEQYGRDSLGIQVNFCRRNGLEIFWSLRMNDRHDAYPMGSRRWTYGLAPFKRDHPESIFGVPEDWEKYPDNPAKKLWSGVDYAQAEVREHIFRLIEEVCEGHDIDGVELDFLRHVPHFREGVEGRPAKPEDGDVMTELLRRLRGMADEVGSRRGKPIMIVPRLPITIELCRFHGLDVERWLAEGLIDFIIAGYGSANFRPMSRITEMVELGHRHNTPVFACLAWGFWQHWAFLDSGYDKVKEWHQAHKSYWEAVDSWPGMLAAWRGAAMSAWTAGVDGLYTFNLFDPDHQILREMGDPNTIARLDKIYGVDYFNKRERAMECKPGESLSINLRLGGDVREESVSQLRLRVHVMGLVGGEDLKSSLNGNALPQLAPVGKLEANTQGHWLDCLLEPSQIKSGENKFELMLGQPTGSTQEPIQLDGLLLEVSHQESALTRPGEVN